MRHLLQTLFKFFAQLFDPFFSRNLPDPLFRNSFFAAGSVHDSRQSAGNGGHGVRVPAKVYCQQNAFPVAAAGFVKIGGMTVAEYLKKRREILRMPVYYYCPEALGRDFLLECRKEASEDSGPKNRKAKRRQSERLFLDEMNSTSENNPVGGEE